MLCGSQMRPILCLMILTSYLMGRGSIRGARSSGAPAKPEKSIPPQCNFHGGGEQKKKIEILFTVGREFTLHLLFSFFLAVFF